MIANDPTSGTSISISTVAPSSFAFAVVAFTSGVEMCTSQWAGAPPSMAS